MTSLLTRPDMIPHGDTMPGWDIVADMTPPELINLRWLAVLRRRIAIALLLVIVLCSAGFGYAFIRHGSANDEADAASARTTDLTRAANQFAGITRIETTVAHLDSQVASVMQSDVDVPRTIAAIRRALPASMSIQSISVTFSRDGSTDGSTGLDVSGHPTIGTVNISGAGQRLDDLPSFVDGLTAIRGVVNVLPTSNSVTKGIAGFSVTLALTDQLYSHQYDVQPSGS